MSRRRGRLNLTRLSLVVMEIKNSKNIDATIRRHIASLLDVLDPVSLVRLYAGIRENAVLAPYIFSKIEDKLYSKLMSVGIEDVITCYFLVKELVESGIISRGDSLYKTVWGVLNERKEEVREFLLSSGLA